MRIMRQVLVKVLGNPAWLEDARVGQQWPQDSLRALVYLDRFTNQSKHDERRSRYRSYYGHLAWSEADAGWNSRWHVVVAWVVRHWDELGQGFDDAYRSGIGGASTACLGTSSSNQDGEVSCGWDGLLTLLQGSGRKLRL